MSERGKRRLGDERGAVMVIAALLMTVLIGVAAYAIDTAIWFVHHDHLQTEADAAALAAGQNLQCTPGTADSAVDSQVIATVHQYDGTGQTAPPTGYAGQTPINAQVWATPTYATTYSNQAHNMFSLVNSANFENQSRPNDSGMSGSPCADGAVDVKLTETNLPSAIPFLNPSYVDAQARVSLKQLTEASGAEPFAEPLPTPNSMTATLVDESNNDAAIAPAVTLTPSAGGTTWTGTAANVTFSNSGSGTFPVGLRVSLAGGGSATCGGSGVDTFENDGSCTTGHGITFTRVWANSGTPGQPATGTPAAPQTNDITVVPTSGSTGCPAGPTGAFSNFISSSTSCTVQVTATNVVFATGSGAPAISCSNAGLTLTVGTGTPVNLSCPSGALNGQTWTSAPITINPNSGLNNLTLTWSLSAGKIPSGTQSGGQSGNCTTTKPCIGTLGVQRVNSGAYDSTSATTSNSGAILGANLVDASTGGELMSVARGYKTSVNITVKELGFTDSTSTSSAPIELSFGGNQANAALECAGTSAGGPQLLAGIAAGCASAYQTTTGSCPNTDSPPSCATENPGNGKLDKELDPGMNQRINGSANATTCVNPSHWVTPNTVDQLKTESPKDPRLILMLITDYGALTNGANQVPIRNFATFYVTGWAGDPCISGTLPSTTLASTHDDDPGSSNTGVLLGHFIEYTFPGTTNGNPCTASTFGDCTPVLTK